MKANEIKTIDIQAMEWFDRINGNSYFAARATINYSMPDEVTVTLPFQYGYGEHYVDMAMSELVKQSIIEDAEIHKYGAERLWQYCDRHNIILRKSKQENCLKRDLKNFIS